MLICNHKSVSQQMRRKTFNRKSNSITDHDMQSHIPMEYIEQEGIKQRESIKVKNQETSKKI